VVTVETLTKALKNTLGRKGMSNEDTSKLADYVLSFFGFEGEIIDNKLTSEDRDVFYMLEEEGLLSTREEETQLKKGKPWRIHYWILEEENIKRLASAPRDNKTVEKDQSIYDKIPDDVWNRD
jgi:hypothetical protein